MTQLPHEALGLFGLCHGNDQVIDVDTDNEQRVRGATRVHTMLKSASTRRAHRGTFFCVKQAKDFANSLIKEMQEYWYKGADAQINEITLPVLQHYGDLHRAFIQSFASFLMLGIVEVPEGPSLVPNPNLPRDKHEDGTDAF